MYEINNGNNNNNTPFSGMDLGASPARQTRRSAPPNPPSPDDEIPWGDRKPAARPTYVYKHSPDIVSELESPPLSKDGIMLQLPEQHKKDNNIPEKKSRKKVNSNRHKTNEMSKRELIWVSIVFALILTLTVVITAVVMKQQTRETKVHKESNRIPTGDEVSPIVIPSTNQGTTARKISVREEWELVQAAILSNNVTRFLLEEFLPRDLFFYDHLVSGMVFSEEERNWIPAPTMDFDFDDDSVSIEGMDGMSMESIASNHRKTANKTLTPNQKATTWLLFYDELKDPNESVWRWAMASIYFKMGGTHWEFHDSSNSKWLTSAPLCEWERIYGSSGCEVRRQQQEPPLPVELDFDGIRMTGEIAAEFALLVQPTTGTPMVRSIMLSDNRLTGTIPGNAFQHLMPSLGKLYLDNNQLTGSIPLELGGLDTLYVQNNAFTGDWPNEFCENGNKNINAFGLDCDKVECSSTCCGILQCYYSKSSP